MLNQMQFHSQLNLTHKLSDTHSFCQSNFGPGLAIYRLPVGLWAFGANQFRENALYGIPLLVNTHHSFAYLLERLLRFLLLICLLFWVIGSGESIKYSLH